MSASNLMNPRHISAAAAIGVVVFLAGIVGGIYELASTQHRCHQPPLRIS